MKVKVLFFGVLAEVAGADTKIYNDVSSVSHLKSVIFDEIPEIINYNFRISVNNEIINDDHDLNDNDEIAFMPPFSGG